MTATAELTPSTPKTEVAAFFNENYEELPEDDPVGLTPKKFGEALLARTALTEQSKAEQLVDLITGGLDERREVVRATRRLRSIGELAAENALIANIVTDSAQDIERAYIRQTHRPWDLDESTIDRGHTSHFN